MKAVFFCLIFLPLLSIAEEKSLPPGVITGRTAGKNFKATCSLLVTKDNHYDDTSVELNARQKLLALGHQVCDIAVVPNDEAVIRLLIQRWIDAGRDLIITFGGTGISPTDTTIEAVAPFVGKVIPNYSTLLCMETQKKWGHLASSLGIIALSSRAMGGVSKNGKTLIFTAPGSPDAGAMAVDIILPELPFLLQQMKKAPIGSCPSKPPVTKNFKSQ